MTSNSALSVFSKTQKLCWKLLENNARREKVFSMVMSSEKLIQSLKSVFLEYLEPLFRELI